MAAFKKTNVKIFLKPGTEASPDSLHWKNYSTPVIFKEFGPIDYIDFSPTEPHHFAVTCSCRIQVYNSITKLVTKNLNKFKEAAYGGSFRRDARLLCAGGEETVVKLFDYNTRSPLRIFSGHSAAVHRTFFTNDGANIISFSDDKTTALWDIVSEKKLASFTEHTDYVRAGSVSPVSNNIYVSGGYDKIVNMYDTRTDKKVFSVNHDAPVESCLFLPSGGIFLSAGGTEIRVWDCFTNGRLLAKISQHHKTITCLRIAYNGQNILSGSLDRQIKIYDSGTYKTVHTLTYPNSVLSIGISSDNQTVVAGMVDGLISVRQKEEVKDTKSVKRQKVAYQYASKNLHSPLIDTHVYEVSKEVIGKHDICLRKFQYTKALDYVMLNYVANKSPHVSVSLLQELIRRQGLLQALAGRDGKSLDSILKFIVRYIGNIRFARVLVHVANVLMNIYEDKLEELNLKSQKWFTILAKKLEEEEELLTSSLELQGIIEMILSAAQVTSVTVVKRDHRFTPSVTAQKDLILNIT